MMFPTYDEMAKKIAEKALDEYMINDKPLRDWIRIIAEQQPSRCDSCTYSEEQDGSNCYECVKGMADNFEAQPTDADCISREAVIDHICESKDCYKEDCKGKKFKRCLDLQWVYDLPSVIPSYNSIKTELEQTIPKGKWIILDECANEGVYCSECHKMVFKLEFSPTMKWRNFKYCPNCGAEMEMENEKETC